MPDYRPGRPKGRGWNFLAYVFTTVVGRKGLRYKTVEDLQREFEYLHQEDERILFRRVFDGRANLLGGMKAIYVKKK